MGDHVEDLEFTLPNSKHLQNLWTPKDKLINETSPEVVNVISKDIFKLPQELLVRAAIENYIKKLKISFVTESYFLYDRSNLIEPTFITEINKLISIYGSVSFFDKRSLGKIVKVVSINKPLRFSVIKDRVKDIDIVFYNLS